MSGTTDDTGYSQTTQDAKTPDGRTPDSRSHDGWSRDSKSQKAKQRKKNSRKAKLRKRASKRAKKSRKNKACNKPHKKAAAGERQKESLVSQEVSIELPEFTAKGSERAKEVSIEIPEYTAKRSTGSVEKTDVSVEVLDIPAKKSNGSVEKTDVSVETQEATPEIATAKPAVDASKPNVEVTKTGIANMSNEPVIQIVSSNLPLPSSSSVPSSLPKSADLAEPKCFNCIPIKSGIIIIGIIWSIVVAILYAINLVDIYYSDDAGFIWRVIFGAIMLCITVCASCSLVVGVVRCSRDFYVSFIVVAIVELVIYIALVVAVAISKIIPLFIWMREENVETSKLVLNIIFTAFGFLFSLCLFALFCYCIYVVIQDYRRLGRKQTPKPKV